MAVDDGGLVMPTDAAPSGPLPPPSKSRSTQVIGGSPDATTSTEAQLQNAFVAYKNGDDKAALTLVQAVLAKEPKNAKAKLLEGRVYASQQKYQEATEAMLTAIEEDPAAVPRAQLYLGEALLAQRKVLEARGAFEAQLKTEPENKDALLLYAMCQAKLKYLQEARDAALKLDQMDAIHPGYFFATAAIARASGKPEKATEAIDSAQTNYGSKIWAQYMKYYLQVFSPKPVGQGEAAQAAPAAKAVAP